MKTNRTPTLADVESARRRIAGGIRRTSCLPVPALSEIVGVSLRLKRDDLHRTGSVRERGARHALLCLDEADRTRGVVCASAGNFALGLAYHGGMLGIRITIVLPAGTPEVKVTHCRSLGATVEVLDGDLAAARARAAQLAAASGAVELDPSVDPSVAAGQATIALEILEQAPAARLVVVPTGGGLPAGVAAVMQELRPGVRVLAVQPPVSGETETSGLGAVTVSDEEIAAATNLLACRAGIVAGPAGAAPLAALLAGHFRAAAGEEVVLAVCAKCYDPRRHTEAVARGAAWLERKAAAG